MCRVLIDEDLKRVLVVEFWHPERPRDALQAAGRGILGKKQGETGTGTRTTGALMAGLAGSIRSAMAKDAEPARRELYEKISANVKFEVLKARLNAAWVAEEAERDATLRREQGATSLFSDQLGRSFALDKGFRSALAARVVAQGQAELDSASAVYWDRIKAVHARNNYLLAALEDAIGCCTLYPPAPVEHSGARPVVKADEDRWDAEVALEPAGSLPELELRYRRWLQQRTDSSVAAGMDEVCRLLYRAEMEASIYRPQLLRWLLHHPSMQESKATAEFRTRCKFKSEVLLAKYTATLLGRTLPTQGHLFLSERYVTFSATMAAHMERIPVRSITKVERKTSSVLKVDNAVAITYKLSERQLAEYQAQNPGSVVQGQGELAVALLLHRDELIAAIEALVDFAKLAGPEEGGSQLALPVHEPLEMVGEVFENERFYPFVGWSSRMLPTDRPAWSDRSGTTSRPIMDEVDSVLPADDWEWAEAWHLEKPTAQQDQDGWQYAIAFSSDTWSASKGFSDVVRKRRWTRTCVRKNPEQVRKRNEQIAAAQGQQLQPERAVPAASSNPARPSVLSSSASASASVAAAPLSSASPALAAAPTPAPAAATTTTTTVPTTTVPAAQSFTLDEEDEEDEGFESFHSAGGNPSQSLIVEDDEFDRMLDEAVSDVKK